MHSEVIEGSGFQFFEHQTPVSWKTVFPWTGVCGWVWGDSSILHLSISGTWRSPGGGNGNPRQYSCQENPMDRVPWCATVHGVTNSRTQLSDFTSLLLLRHEVRLKSSGVRSWRLGTPRWSHPGRGLLFQHFPHLRSIPWGHTPWQTAKEILVHEGNWRSWRKKKHVPLTRSLWPKDTGTVGTIPLQGWLGGFVPFICSGNY